MLHILDPTNLIGKKIPILNWDVKKIDVIDYWPTIPISNESYPHTSLACIIGSC